MSITAPQGFEAAGVHGGLKADGALDFALVATTDRAPAAAAATFTSSRFPAAPVVLSKHHLAQSRGRAAAVLLNSGNANAGTGTQGREDAAYLAAAVAGPLGLSTHEVLVCSTGLIGDRLPIDAMGRRVPDLIDALSGDGSTAARAIMTTDTVAKETVVDGGTFKVGGMAKGAAMLAPSMATMLAVLTTDVAIEPWRLQPLLGAAVAESFNRLSVDGCQSTNDTVIVLAGGAAGTAEGDRVGAALADACQHLASQMAGDAEGATKVVRIIVTGARNDAEADRAARQIAESALCKCSWYGKDAYWGRLAAELGVAGVALEPMYLSISYGDVEVCRNGVNHGHDPVALAAYMEGRDIEITCDLGLGRGSGWVLTNDLTHGYVDENMGTS
ncbi:MAG TPA: bifunctional glutamate N-acetyltransferase/amino-acid acetyltransferase ArgJ [Acidimicrobiales bacterium]